MAGYWAHTPLLWPCGVFDPHDPLLTATLRRMEANASRYGSGVLSEGPGGFWPYISIDWAIGYILRGEPDKAVDLFCAYVDNAGPTLSWGEGYASASNLAGGDQPHGWADAQYVNLLRHLLVMEQEDTLHLLPAVPRGWLKGPAPIRLERLPTHFGALSLRIERDEGRETRDEGRRTGDRGRGTRDERRKTKDRNPAPASRVPRPASLSETRASPVNVHLRLAPRGDQRLPRKVVLHLRLPDGQRIRRATVNGKATEAYTDETLIVPWPKREMAIAVGVE
jgi:hypothetical protein